jgi:hypothetical protein
MGELRTVFVLSDIHYAAAAERERGCTEFQVIHNLALRLFVKAYRHFIWRRDPFAHNHLLDRFLAEARGADYVVANGDYSCDTAFVGVSDPAAFQSARECLEKMRRQFGPNLQVNLGDHELGKMSLFGGCGGMRMASWNRAEQELGLAPLWNLRLGRYLLVGVTSSLLALPVMEPDILPEEKKAWLNLRRQHQELLHAALSGLAPEDRLLLFCHDPTALPFLWEDEFVRARLAQIEATVIGHLHSPAILWKSRMLAGMPTISFLGNSVRRMSTALHQGRIWRPFRVKLCPSLGGIELLKDGGYIRVVLDLTGRLPLRFESRLWKEENLATTYSRGS